MNKPPPRPSEWEPFPLTPEEILLETERHRLSKSSETQQNTAKNEEYRVIGSSKPVESGNFGRFDNSYLERNEIFDPKMPKIHQKPPTIRSTLPDFPPEFSDEIEDSDVSDMPKLNAIFDLDKEPESLPKNSKIAIDRYAEIETEGFGSSLKILRAIGDLLDMVYTDEFAGMKRKIDEAKERFRRQDKPISLDTISISLRSALLAIKNSAKPAEKSQKSSEDSKALFGILVMLWGISLSLQPIILEDFQKDVTDSMMAVVKSNEEKKVSIQALHTVLDLLLLTIIV
ncbi:hypothetical protein CRE_28679 [Caenorhabditis remanei]|uniref:Uncharacterized protein n=1 Tax=Caenorhabditis remanei TaxID=31234 RepID=E3MJZ4_CAERE|nr:hypothetical protein CRE_28679 [Caenorhabditis remanei]